MRHSFTIPLSNVKALRSCSISLVFVLTMSCSKQPDDDLKRLAQENAKLRQQLAAANAASPAKPVTPAALQPSAETAMTPAASYAYYNFDQAFHANRPAFMRQYGNKPIQIRAIALDRPSDTVLKVGGSIGWDTTCYFHWSQIPKLDQIRSGDHVTIIGRLGDNGDNTAKLMSCQLLDRRPGDGSSDISE